jgi:hypothetical protein
MSIADSKKPYFKIVDCTDATLDHRLITAVDMFVTGTDEVKTAVKKAAAEAKAPLSQEELDALAQQELERIRIAKEIEERRKTMVGRATGLLVGEEVDLTNGTKRCVGTYRNPLKGKYGGFKMSELPDNYIAWACQAPTIKGWVRGLFIKERGRRNERRADRHQHAGRNPVPSDGGNASGNRGHF